ncbi:unnamed protein product [Somion occarium]|uniref:Uncharacterized protein n=1 Tax=Somion occarium TaxID=3059160 RepID=A0ABP1DVJ9_9APHY
MVLSLALIPLNCSALTVHFPLNPPLSPTSTFIVVCPADHPPCVQLLAGIPTDTLLNVVYVKLTVKHPPHRRFYSYTSSAMNPTEPAAETRSEMIEQIFARVEEESARRAQQEAEQEEASSHQEAYEAQDNVPSPVATVAAIKQRRRGSVSVSRFGQPTEFSPEPIVATSTSPSTRPSRSSSIVIQKATFYSVQPHHHGSADSLASETADDPAKLIEDVHHSTQMATIAGRQSLSKAITRRLSRARTRSKDVLVTAGNNVDVVIDVAVTEATVEVRHSADEVEMYERPQSSAAVYSGSGTTLKSPRSNPGLRSPEKASWMAKCRDLTTRWKRRSVVAHS